MGTSLSKGGIDKSNPYTRTKPLRLFLYLKGGLDESSPYKEIKPTHKNKAVQVIFISKRWV